MPSKFQVPAFHAAPALPHRCPICWRVCHFPTAASLKDHLVGYHAEDDPTRLDGYVAYARVPLFLPNELTYEYPCHRCGRCCTRPREEAGQSLQHISPGPHGMTIGVAPTPTILLTDADLQALRETNLLHASTIHVQDFYDYFNQYVFVTLALNHLHWPDGQVTCCFYDPLGHACLIHEIRPLQCQVAPFTVDAPIPFGLTRWIRDTKPNHCPARRAPITEPTWRTLGDVAYHAPLYGHPLRIRRTHWQAVRDELDGFWGMPPTTLLDYAWQLLVPIIDVYPLYLETVATLGFRLQGC